MYFGTKFLESKKKDDVVGAIPVICLRYFGTLVVQKAIQIQILELSNG
ncbi:MAG: hypothetical protein CM1200mP13_13060 [Candidatus Pelagibacterales bacterium]|nr:MAG: hypothetical protein CM1200mP13_13060 [Pelagibacterales bacterium]